MRLVLLVLASSLALPLVQAQAPPSNTVDIVVTVPAEGEPAQEGPSEILTFVGQTPQRVEWRLTTERAHVSLELRIARTFGVERAPQVVPRLQLDEGEARCIDVRARGACDDDTFAPHPNDRVWEAEDISRAYHRSGALGALVLRLNVPGPTNGTLVLEPDTTPPALTVGEPRDITHYSFYMETRTAELAIADVQVRKVGATEWVVNPTPEPNLLQKFPVQGLSPDTEYEYRVVARDWAGNEFTTDVRRVRSAPQPVVPVPLVTPVEPVPNSTVPQGEFVVVRASVSSPESPLLGNVQIFFDKQAVTEGIQFDGANLSYTPAKVLAPGRHSVGVEVVNEAGGKGVARWTFEVAAPQSTPLGWILAPLALALAMALARRRD